jgi:hypothetical protein
VTGLTTPQCVLFTAGDACMRDFALVVPRDCVAAADAGQHWLALTFTRRFAASPSAPTITPSSISPAVAGARPTPLGIQQQFGHLARRRIPRRKCLQPPRCTRLVGRGAFQAAR